MATAATTVCKPAGAPASPPATAEDDCRRRYQPSVWGDFFITHQQCTPEELRCMEDKARATKEEVRRIVVAAAASGDLRRKLDLVDTLQRLGMDYHFKEEIDGLLSALYDDKDGGSDDLCLTSLRFYLLRKHGYAVSSDVFEKFRDQQGNISSDDAETLLMLYDAAHVRIRGEGILDNVASFNKARLRSLLLDTNLPQDLLEEVRVTLETPRFRRVQRVEAMRFISVYEKSATRDDTILEFAKLDFNIVQVLYCKELKHLSMWWKDLRSQVDLSFSRDRLVEMYFWMMGIVFDPHYTYSRIMLTKTVMFIALLDDIYDNYSTTEESNIFTAALERWDEKAAEQIPESLRPFYRSVLCTVDDVVTELKKQNNKNADVVREMMLHVAKSYHAEVKWRDECYVPADVDEHLQVSLDSIAGLQALMLTWVSLGDVTTREIIEWGITYPKIVMGFTVIARVMNDIMSHEREQASDHMASTVQTCMKQYGVTVEEAIEKLREILEKAWMDMIQDSLERKYPMELFKKGISFAQTMHFFYKTEDLYTAPSNLKATLTSLYTKKFV